MRVERWLYVVRLRLRSLFRRDRLDRELDEELVYHIQRLTVDNLARGMTEEEARYAALRAFGGVAQRKEECCDARRMGLVEDFVKDIRYALRMMRRSPSFTTVAVLSLAVGIGANTAIFSVLDGLMLRKLPVPNPERLVMVDTEFQLTFPQFVRLRERSTVFSGMSAIWTIARSNMTIPNPGEAGATEPDAGQVRVGLASADYFSTLGVKAIVGRTFASDEDRIPGLHPVAVISYAYWERRFARTPDILGRTFGLNGISYAIVGVTPRGFSGEWVGMPTDLWVPFMMASQVMPEIPGAAERFPTHVIARIKPDVTMVQAQAAARLLYQQLLRDDAGATLAQERLAEISRVRLELESAERGYSPQRRTFAQPIAILMVAVGLLLLVACANLANLLLARSAARQREIAVRLAIGAARGRLVRQMLTESVALAMAGGVLGVWFALWAGQTLAAMIASAPVSMGGQSTGLILDLRLDSRALAFTMGLSLLSALLFGVAPAVSAGGCQVSPILTTSGTRILGVGRQFGPSATLVVPQVVLSLLLLIGAALFVRTLGNLRSQELGFDREHLLLVWTVPGQTGRQDTAIAALWHTVQERLSALPGVVSAAASNQPVLRGDDLAPGSPAVSMRVDGEPGETSTMPGLRSFITPGFFQTAGVPVLAGREFTERDTETAPRVAIINEAMARYYFGDRSAVGRLVRFAGSTSTPTEIVGVVSDFVKGTPRGGRHAEFATYFSYQDREALNRGAQSRLRVMLIAVRTVGNPLEMAGRVRRELHAIDPAIPILRINTVDQQLDDVLAQDRLLAAISTFFGAAAVLLFCLGLFGLVSYRVARRTNEIGIRLALGATRGAVLGMVIGEGARLVTVGVITGLVVATAATRLISARLYGVSASDPLTIAGAAATVLLVAALAMFLPARRASRVDPMIALRCE